jgi:hypothetical protein
MEQSEKEKLFEEIRSIISEEVAPVVDILMAYLDVQFEIVDERFRHLFGTVAEVAERVTEAAARGDFDN